MSNDTHHRARLRRTAITAAAATAVLFIAALAGWRLIESDRQREMVAWQARLAIVADSRTQAVSDWLAEGVAGLRAIASNGAVQLYLGELAAGDNGPDTDAAQLAYLRTLLVTTADRIGFFDPHRSADVAANVDARDGAGLVLVDKRGHPLAATPGMPAPTPAVRAAIAQALTGEPATIDLYIGASGLPAIGYVLPIYPVQAAADAPVGAILGLRIADDGLFRRLHQPGDTLRSADTRLVRQSGPLIEYLSPGRDGTPPLGRSLDAATPRLADALALARPGGFDADAVDVDGRPALMVSRPVPGMAWTLVRTIDREEAFADGEHRRVLLAAGVAAFLLLLAVSARVLARRPQLAAVPIVPVADDQCGGCRAPPPVVSARREAMLDALVDALIGIIDARDPHAVHHAARVAEVATTIAQEMGFDAAAQDELQMAARLCTLGRIAIPEALLTKRESLDIDERTRLAGSARASADLLRDVPLEGEVVTIIEQIGERWDGFGPLGLAGEAIHGSARILAVAYAFTGMVSPRAYRPPLGFDDALVILQTDARSRFDRRVVSALAHLLDNRGAAARWRHFLEIKAS